MVIEMHEINDNKIKNEQFQLQDINYLPCKFGPGKLFKTGSSPYQ